MMRSPTLSNRVIVRVCKCKVSFTPVADLRGAQGTRAPSLGVQILSISCSFWQNLAKSYVGAPPHSPGNWRPSSGKSWIRHCTLCVCVCVCVSVCVKLQHYVVVQHCTEPILCVYVKVQTKTHSVNGRTLITGADLGFLVGGAPTLQEGAPANKFARFSQKTAWN